MSAEYFDLSKSFGRRHYSKPIQARVAERLIDMARPLITDPTHAESLKVVIENFRKAEREFLATAVVANKSTITDLLVAAIDAARAEGGLRTMHPDWHGPLKSLQENTEAAMGAVLDALYPPAVETTSGESL